MLNSGLALGYYDLFHRTPGASAYLVEMTELLLAAQYKAVSAVAILEAQQNPEKRIPISFTMVGGGAFGNDKIAIAKSISKAIKLINESGINNIDICLSIYNASEIEEYKKIAENGPEFAELRALLNQKPITQQQLRGLQKLQVESIKEIAHGIPVVEPMVEEDKVAMPPPLANKQYVHTDIVQAMNAAIDALSKKSHLSTESHQQKRNNLEGLRALYLKANSTEDANTQLLRFVIAASRQRESYWCSLFTSKFGETSSAKAFFEKVQSPELKKMLLKVTEIKSTSGKQVEFKEFAKVSVRNMKVILSRIMIL